MDCAKIKSKTTYHNYLKDLNEWEYLKYYPSYHPARGSKIKMFIFETSLSTQQVQNMANSVPEPGQNLIPSYKHKTKENFFKRHPIKFNEKEVLLFFEKNNWEAVEARKFYAYIKSKKWKTDNWQIIAQIYAKNDFKLKEPKKTSPISGYVNRIRQSSENNNGD